MDILRSMSVGFEITTGPLGQGIANAVSLTIASKNVAANFNQPGLEIIQASVFYMTRDGCLMEGIALEDKYHLSNSALSHGLILSSYQPC